MKVDTPFRHELMNNHTHSSVCINAEIINVLQISSTQPISLIAVNRVTSNRVVVYTDNPNDKGKGQLGTLSFDNDIFILRVNDYLSFCYRCPALLLPYMANPICRTESHLKVSSASISWGLTYYFHVQFTQLGSWSADASYGVPVVSLHCIRNRNTPEYDPPWIHVRFWVRSDWDEGYTGTVPGILPV